MQPCSNIGQNLGRIDRILTECRALNTCTFVRARTVHACCISSSGKSGSSFLLKSRQRSILSSKCQNLLSFTYLLVGKSNSASQRMRCVSVMLQSRSKDDTEMRIDSWNNEQEDLKSLLPKLAPLHNRVESHVLKPLKPKEPKHQVYKRPQGQGRRYHKRLPEIQKTKDSPAYSREPYNS